jgi:hypothetical protein
MAQNKSVHIELKEEKAGVKCEGCEQPRTVLITVGYNSIRVCYKCAYKISEKVKQELLTLV